MMRWITPVAAAAAVAVAIPTLAGAAGGKKKTCKFHLTGHFAEVVKKSGNPPASGSDLLAGAFDGKFCGKTIHGAARIAAKYAAPKAQGDAQQFAPLGSVKGHQTGTGKLNPDGSVSLSGTGTITSGTGTYKGAKGSYTFTGKYPKNSTVLTTTVDGSVTY
jgi:hypothetical protein